MRLHRKGVVAPPGWDARLAKRLGVTAAEFRRMAKRFERLALNGKKRRGGFAAYAPHTLPIGKKGGCEFPALWRRVKALKVTIAAMSGGHCAYCQSPVSADQAGQVEHFRPKSLFPTLAYTIDNYFLGCEACNTTKCDKWPAAGEYVRPDQGEPSSRFVFSEDGNVVEAAGDLEAEATIEDLKLHRKGLGKARKLMIEAHLKPVHVVLGRKRLSISMKRELVRAMLVPRLFPYSAAINQSVRRAWRGAFPHVRL